MYDKILIPINGTQGPEEHIKPALELANWFDATVHGLYVLDSRLFHSLIGTKKTKCENDIQKNVEQKINSAIETSDYCDINLRSSVRQGIPHQEILSYSRHHNIDIIVMATPGGGMLNNFLLGSVADKVVRGSSIPIHLVPISNEA